MFWESVKETEEKSFAIVFRCTGVVCVCVCVQKSQHVICTLPKNDETERDCQWGVLR